MKPRSFALGLVLLLVATSVAFRGASDRILRGPYLGVVSDRGIVVSWTAERAGVGVVLYGRDGATNRVAGDDSYGTFHRIALAGLEPGTTYTYRVACGRDTSAAYSFSTAPPPGASFDFAVYGDTRTDHPAHVRVLERMQAAHPAFVINTGDLVSSNTTENWDDYFKDLCVKTTIGCTTAFFCSPGNHEAGAMYYDLLALPRDNPDSSKAYYTFRFGDLFALSLNTEIPYKPGSAQYRWLEAVLASPDFASAKFRIAFWHRPPYSSSSHGSDAEIRAAWCPLMEAHGVDLVFNGHDHGYERTKPFGGTTYVVSGGGGAPLYDFKTQNSWTAYREKAHHFCRLSVTPASLRMEMVRDDGVVRDTLVIRK